MHVNLVGYETWKDLLIRLTCCLLQQMKCSQKKFHWTHLICPSGKEPTQNIWRGEAVSNKTRRVIRQTLCLTQNKMNQADFFTAGLMSCSQHKAFY